MTRITEVMELNTEFMAVPSSRVQPGNPEETRPVSTAAAARKEEEEDMMRETQFSHYPTNNCVSYEHTTVRQLTITDFIALPCWSCMDFVRSKKSDSRHPVQVDIL